MNVPKIMLDETKTRIVNKEEIVKYILFYMDNESLAKCKELFIKQNNLSFEEIKSIINAIDYRSYIIDSNIDDEEKFYLDNLDYISECFKEVYNSTNINSRIEDLLVKFLKYCIEEKEEKGIQNDYNMQSIFNDCKYNYDLKMIKNENFNNKIKDIMAKKDTILNQTDNNAGDYKEDNYLSRTQVLNFAPYKTPGHSLTKDNEQKYGGFIFTSIILQSSLVLAFILSMIMLFK